MFTSSLWWDCLVVIVSLFTTKIYHKLKCTGSKTFFSWNDVSWSHYSYNMSAYRISYIVYRISYIVYRISHIVYRISYIAYRISYIYICVTHVKGYSWNEFDEFTMSFFVLSFYLLTHCGCVPDHCPSVWQVRCRSPIEWLYPRIHSYWRTTSKLCKTWLEWLASI